MGWLPALQLQVLGVAFSPLDLNIPSTISRTAAAWLAPVNNLDNSELGVKQVH